MNVRYACDDVVIIGAKILPRFSSIHPARIRLQLTLPELTTLAGSRSLAQKESGMQSLVLFLFQLTNTANRVQHDRQDRRITKICLKAGWCQPDFLLSNALFFYSFFGALYTMQWPNGAACVGTIDGCVNRQRIKHFFGTDRLEPRIFRFAHESLTRTRAYPVQTQTWMACMTTVTKPYSIVSNKEPQHWIVHYRLLITDPNVKELRLVLTYTWAHGWIFNDFMIPEFKHLTLVCRTISYSTLPTGQSLS